MPVEYHIVGGGGPAFHGDIPSALLQSFYAGDQIDCPFGCGGHIHSVGVGTLESGGGDLWLECGCCAQRNRIMVPPATEAERNSIDVILPPGVAPTCPRHAGRISLRQNGRQLVCPACGVRFRE